MALKKKGGITEEQLAEVIAEHQKTGKRLGRAAVELGYIQEEDLLKALSAQLSLPYVRISVDNIDPEAARLIPEGVSRRYDLIPLRRSQERLVVAMADPLNDRACREVELISGCEIEMVISTEGDIWAGQDHVYGSPQPDQERSADDLHKKIGEFFLEGEFINEEQLNTALKRQKANGDRLGSTLVNMGVISEEDWMQTLGIQLGLPFVHLTSYGLKPQVVKTIPEKLARHYCLIPIAKQQHIPVSYTHLTLPTN